MWGESNMILILQYVLEYIKKVWKTSYSWQTCWSQTASCSDKHVLLLFQCTSYLGNNPRTNFPTTLVHLLLFLEAFPYYRSSGLQHLFLCLMLCVSLPSLLPIFLSVRGFNVSLHSSLTGGNAPICPNSLSLCMLDDLWEPFLLIPSPTPTQACVCDCRAQLSEWAGTSWLVHLPVAAQPGPLLSTQERSYSVLIFQ